MQTLTRIVKLIHKGVPIEMVENEDGYWYELPDDITSDTFDTLEQAIEAINEI